MKTHLTIIVPMLATLLWVGVTGCQSSGSASADPPGPATSAVLLSSKKTFDIIGRTGMPITYSKPEDPAADVTSEVVRTKLESLGYQYHPGAPEFVVSIAWDKFQQLEQPSPTATESAPLTNPVVAFDRAALTITARDSASGVVLWQSEKSEAVDPHMVTESQARAFASAALKDFPPAQTGK